MSLIDTYLRKNFIFVESSDPVSKSLGKMISHNVNELFVVDKGVYKGLITIQRILDEKINPLKAKIKSLSLKSPYLSSKESTLSAINKLISAGVGTLPVLEDNGIVGAIYAQDLLTEYKTHEHNIEEIMQVDPPILEANDPISKARHLIISTGLNYAIVVDDNHKLAGIVPASAIARTFFRHYLRTTRGEMNGEKYSLFDISVKNIMNKSPKHLTAGTDLATVIKRFHDDKVQLFPVLNENSEPVGVITPTIILDFMTKKIRRQTVVNIIGLRDEKAKTIYKLKKMIFHSVRRISTLLKEFTSVTVYIGRTKKGKHPYYKVTTRLLVGKRVLTSSARNWDLITCGSESFKKLERTLRFSHKKIKG
jgi:CBS domain-containing protein